MFTSVSYRLSCCFSQCVIVMSGKLQENKHVAFWMEKKLKMLASKWKKKQNMLAS